MPLWEGVLGPHLTQCARAEAHHHAMFHLYPSNHLATLHQCYRQTGQTDRTGQWSDSIRRTILETVAQKQMPLLITKQQRLHTLGQMYHHSVTSKY